MQISLRVSDDELAARKAAWKRPSSPVRTGALAKYRNEVSSASEGAVTIPPAWDD
jgi:dihydroxy-acid dehydratase